MDEENALAYVCGTIDGITSRLEEYRVRYCYRTHEDQTLGEIIKDYDGVSKYIVNFLKRMDERRKDERSS